ncbi:unnamed protein product, partial [Larinioides sclopetarius]
KSGPSSVKAEDPRKINFVTLKKSVSNPITFEDLLNDNGILKFPEEEDVYYDKCLLENCDIEWMSKSNEILNLNENQDASSSSVLNEDKGRKIQLIRETVEDDMVNNPKKYSPSKLAPKKISTMMLPPPGHSSSKAENSSAVGNKTLVKILPPPRFE